MNSKISNIFVIKTDSYFPYHNQALEECLLYTVDDDSVILYLWQNNNTVFIGKNQNAYKECNIQELEKDGGYLARRISGGGAVYHDLGNLNFTFVSSIHNHDIDKQNKVVLEALNSLGVECYLNGRNDLELYGKKFSGHAYYRNKDKAFHHGTIMLEVDYDKLQRYLNVSKLKLVSKGVESVRSRVINLIDFYEDLTIRKLKRALIDSFEKVYGLEANLLTEEDLDEELLDQLEDTYTNPDWKYGTIKNHRYAKEKKYDWGLLKIEYDLDKDILTDISVYTDCLDVDSLNKTKELIGKNINDLREEYNRELNDLIKLLKE